ncbi:hypothetical protein GUJ93_ZPchr0011g27845 [Zizania palustris]|uniref:Uncharacterized protein n=1 Tax=Zizania palustris TaxID=103762 RepID=A0A8J5WHG8_ZIZPA|nr:hypothetical protein GUJ93_ZPchr0011g27845 [Zizania palustris]
MRSISSKMSGMPHLEKKLGDIYISSCIQGFKEQFELEKVKYVGDEEKPNGLQMTDLNMMDKTLAVRGARIAFNIWDIAGDNQFLDHVPIVLL